MTTTAAESAAKVIGQLQQLHDLAVSAAVTVRAAEAAAEENEGLVDRKVEASLEQASWWIKDAIERIDGQLQARERAAKIMFSSTAAAAASR